MSRLFAFALLLVALHGRPRRAGSATRPGSRPRPGTSARPTARSPYARLRHRERTARRRPTPPRRKTATSSSAPPIPPRPRWPCRTASRKARSTTSRWSRRTASSTPASRASPTPPARRSRRPAKFRVPTSHPAPYTRKVAVYVPKQYVPGTVAPLIVGADGPDRGLFTASIT